MKYFIIKYETDSMMDCVIAEESSKDYWLDNYMSGNSPTMLKDINGNVTVLGQVKNLQITELYNIKMIEIKE